MKKHLQRLKRGLKTTKFFLFIILIIILICLLLWGFVEFGQVHPYIATSILLVVATYYFGWIDEKFK